MFKPSRTSILLGTLALLSVLPGAEADELCPTTWDPAPTGGGVVNTYYEGTATVAAGAMSIPVGAQVGPTPIAAGDLLLIIQMQDALIFTGFDDDRYGDNNPPDGVPGDGVGRGFWDARETGKFEYLVAGGSVGVPVAGEVAVVGKGAGAGTLNTYTNAAATATEGRRSFQLIRVPRYMDLDMTAVGMASLEAGYWDGQTGGILAIDVRDALTLDGTNLLTASGRGFRGGLGQRLLGTPGATSSNYMYPSLPGFSTVGAHGNKGEGIAGTSRYVRTEDPGAPSEEVENADEGYPGGSRARGAPGNAGGGGTDGKPSSNNDSAGGGGGGNGGPGGRGGNTASGLATGGHGGAAFELPSGPLWLPSLAYPYVRAVLGGGGGSGSKNDNSPDESSGATGGGIILIRTGSFAGSGTIEANGDSAPSTGNDGGGGGGAGGSIVIVSKSTAFAGTLAINADGGRGSDAGSGTSVLGPGGGGGGGVVLVTALSGGTVIVSTEPGDNGVTDNPPVPNGSTTGSVGTADPPGAPGAEDVILPGNLPGADPAADCAVDDAPVAVDDGPQVPLYTIAQGGTLTIGAAGDPAPAGVLLNDTDPDTALSALTAVLVEGPTAAEGLLTFNPNGSFEFVADGAFVGVADFSYRVDDGPNLSNIAWVRIAVGDVNDPPVNVLPAPGPTDEDVPITFSGPDISVSDPDAGTADLTVTLTLTLLTGSGTSPGILTLGAAGAAAPPLTSLTGNGTTQVVLVGSQAEITAALVGAVYTPPANWSGTAQLEMVSNDGGATGPGGPQSDTNTVVLTVNAVNDAPVAAPDSYRVGRGRTLTVNAPGVLSNDIDVDGPAPTVALVGPPPAEGLLLLNANGSFTYEAPKNFVGTVTFDYQIDDGSGSLTNLSSIITVTIRVFNVEPALRAGYCGLTGLEGFALLGLLALLRRLRSR